MTSPRLILRTRFRLRHGDEDIPWFHDDRLSKVHPAAFAHGRLGQKFPFCARIWVNFEDRNRSPVLDALQMHARYDPLVRKAKSKEGVLVEGQLRGRKPFDC